jgi:hypothetical protein
MSQPELLKLVVHVLNDAGIEYMLTGSLASSLQGEPRSTHDVDIVVSIEHSAVKDLVSAFPPPDYYLSEEAVLDALRDRGMFNLIEVNTGDKVDFWILTDQPFDVSRFARKYAERIMGMDIYVSSYEDTILMKLSWADRLGGSEKHFTDALRVFEVQYGKLDLNYLEEWAERLNVEKLFKKVKEEAEIL